MTRAAIVERLARQFSVEPDRVRSVLEMLDAGLSAPYIGRVRRAEAGNVSESTIRRVDRMRRELDELDRRRRTILRMLEGEKEPASGDGVEDPGNDPLREIRECMDRFELEDLFLPHRRPEPEVQLAQDRGLDALADLLVAAPPRPAPGESPAEEAQDAPSGGGDEAPAPGGAEPTPEEGGGGAAAADRSAETPAPETDSHAGGRSGAREGVRADLPGMRGKIELTPQLARLCTEFVNPDRGVHTEEEALAGAVRILSDRLGRNPRLRSTVRRLIRKHGMLSVRATDDEAKLGRQRALLKLKEPLRQVQGRRLLAIRQAQKDRAVATMITLDPGIALPKVKAALGRRFHPDYEGVIDAVVEQAFHQRLVPMIEADVRLELKERGDEEALRFLSQHLRQILLAPGCGPHPVVGLSVNAKQDWLLVLLGADGQPRSEEIKIETQEKDVAALSEALSQALRGSGVRAIAVGHGKSSRAQIPRLRECIRLLDADAEVFVVNEAGLSSYANSEAARNELGGFTVPGRMAVTLGRRHQDSLLEFLKVDPRHLGLGPEQGLVSKANLRRTLNETVESCVAHVGCDLNTAPLAFLRRLPGLDHGSAGKIVERRSQRPFLSREELRESGILTEAQWSGCIAFLRIPDSPEPLDRTSLHPEQYPLARRVIEASGGTVGEVLGARGATKGMRRTDFDVDEATWRDLMREIAYPGRDPRPRLFFPQLLDPTREAEELKPGAVVEGIVSNVASFGAFVDLGISRDGLIHISEASVRYVRDARELLSIGQVVRARVLDTTGQRVALSLKGVPDRERGPRPGDRRERPDRHHRPRKAAGERKEAEWSELGRTVRAAQSRRDGLAGGKGEGGRRKGRGRSGGARQGGRRGRERDDQYDAEAVRRAENLKVSFNPFATFFKKDDEGESEDPAASQEPPQRAGAE